MKIISFDVGIKNLAFCLFEKSSDVFNITKWDTIDISTTEEKNVCQFIEKNIQCSKPSKFKKDDKCYCLKHSKKQSFQIPKQEQKISFINKQKLQKLYEIADNHHIKYDPKIKKKVPKTGPRIKKNRKIKKTGPRVPKIQKWHKNTLFFL